MKVMPAATIYESLLYFGPYCTQNTAVLFANN